MAQWVESKTVGGVSEVTLLTPIRQGTVPGETRSYEQRLNFSLLAFQAAIPNIAANKESIGATQPAADVVAPRLGANERAVALESVAISTLFQRSLDIDAAALTACQEAVLLRRHRPS